MIKKCMWVQCKALSNKDIMIIKVASYMKYIDIKLVCPNMYRKLWGQEANCVAVCYLTPFRVILFLLHVVLLV